jgi:hypothetical protein
MTTARHLAMIDLLRTRAFPARRGSASAVTSGPGYHIASLETSKGFWDDDGTERIAAGQRYEQEYGALGAALSARWGRPQLFSLQGALLRAADGEGIPSPWRELSTAISALSLWRAGERWIALGVCQQGSAQPLRLLAAVTTSDPP